jgi:hypothetical protein
LARTVDARRCARRDCAVRVTSAAAIDQERYCHGAYGQTTLSPKN